MEEHQFFQILRGIKSLYGWAWKRIHLLAGETKVATWEAILANLLPGEATRCISQGQLDRVCLLTTILYFFFDNENFSLKLVFLKFNLVKFANCKECGLNEKLFLSRVISWWLCEIFNIDIMISCLLQKFFQKYQRVPSKTPCLKPLFFKVGTSVET